MDGGAGMVLSGGMKIVGWMSVGLLGVAVAGGELRQGAFHTPEEAKAEMEERERVDGTREAWLVAAGEIRRGILEGAGLWPLPERTGLAPIRREARKMDGYTVENVAFESVPGFFVTGNLYLPEGRERFPVVLCPHGHWGGEDLNEHGRLRADMQRRCGALALAGCAVFAWDAVGFGESKKLGWRHDYAPEVLKLQLWNGIRSLDFLLSLPGADGDRVAVTGASGGGTLTMQLAAVDERVDLSVPCVMVSSWFYGGCVCESGLPVHVRPGRTANAAEIAAVFAPKPQLVISCGADWTKTVPEIEFPFLKRRYAVLGAEDAVENAHFADGGHDYGEEKRAALYPFVARHFRLDAGEADEERVRVLKAEELLVFGEERPVPGHALEPNRAPVFAP
jgi:dienelactone hydrolase